MKEFPPRGDLTPIQRVAKMKRAELLPLKLYPFILKYREFSGERKLLIIGLRLFHGP